MKQKTVYTAGGSENAAAYTERSDEYRRRVGAFVGKYMGE